MNTTTNLLKLTIIIPAYNVENFIIQALNSINNQKNINESDFEVIIINDGSNDNSENVIMKWIAENNVKNYHYYKKNNGNWGSVVNFVKNNKIAQGKYVSILDADDYYTEDAFRSFFNVIDKEDYDLVLSNYFENKNNKLKRAHVMFGKEGKVDPKNAHTGWSIPLCKFFNTKLFYKMNDLEEHVSYQDQILYHSFALNSKKVYFIKKELGVYWVERIGSSTAEKWNQKRIQIWSSNMNKLLKLNSPQISAYVIFMIFHAKNNMKKEDYKYFKIEKENIHLLKKASFSWLPFGSRSFAKIYMKIFTKKIIKK